MSNDHVPVMLTEAMHGLNIRPEGLYLDLTIGRGGHASEILKKLTSGKLIGFDQDDTAIAALSDLAKAHPNLTLIHANFVTLKEELARLKMTRVDGALMDLGVSSPQFDIPERGFSYRADGPLDMRMDRRQPLTARTILAQSTVEQLTKIFRDYGDEKFAFQLAKAIEKRRKTEPLETTLQLVALIKEVKPDRELKKKGHPAKQVFQALRIAVNQELSVLKRTLYDILDILAVGGRLVVITFHSGEDRIVKECFKEMTEVIGSRRGPASIAKSELKPFRLVEKKPLVPSPKEVAANHRAESAKMRIIERIKL